MNNLERIIIFSHHRQGGGTPLDSLWFAKDSLKQNNVILIFRWTGNFTSSLKLIFLYKNILFDGKSSLFNHKGPLILLCALLLKKNISLYWHETEWSIADNWPIDPEHKINIKNIYRKSIKPVIVQGRFKSLFHYLSRFPAYLLLRSSKTKHLHVCNYGKEMLHNKYRIPAENIKVLNNSSNYIDLSNYPLPRLAKKPTFVSCGPLTDRKRPDLFLKVAESISEKVSAEFIWIGGGSTKSENEFKATVELMQNVNVTLTGHVENPAVWMYKASVYLHTAEDDPMPKVLMEALALGKPVVAFGVCGIPELLNNHGSIIEFGNIEDFSKAALDAMKNDTKEKQSNRRKYYSSKYTSEMFAKRFKEIIPWLMEK